jgi:hypothetical protein
MKNIAARPVHLEWGACSMRLQLFASATFTGAPVFDAFEWPSITRDLPGITRVCPTYLATRDLAPGETVAPSELVVQTTIQGVVGDSLPAGKYYLRARAQLVSTARGFHEVWLDIPAGDVQLRR